MSATSRTFEPAAVIHWDTTSFAKRAEHRVPWLAPAAKALEALGVKATYHVHDSLTSNAASRRRFRAARPDLDDVQRTIVASLQEQDYAVTSFPKLFPAEKQAWEELLLEARGFAKETREGLERETHGLEGGLARSPRKSFTVYRRPRGASVGSADPWFRLCASPRLLAIVNTYLGMWAKLQYVNYWYTIPRPRGGSRLGSQQWHRDYDDKHLLKVFLYLSEVDKESGAFECIPRSTRGKQYGGVLPWRPHLVQSRLSPRHEAQIPTHARHTVTGPPGTVVLCNTSCIHRGGYAIGHSRVVAIAEYCSPASAASLTRRGFIPDLRPGMAKDPEVFFALS